VAFSIYDLGQLLTLLEAPPRFTWKEIRGLVVDLCEADAPSADRVMHDFLERITNELDLSPEVSQEYALLDVQSDLFHFLVRARNSFVETAVDRLLAAEVTGVLNREVNACTGALRVLGADLGTIRRHSSGYELWLGLLSHVETWIGWGSSPVYEEFCDDGLALLEEMFVELTGPDRAVAFTRLRRGPTGLRQGSEPPASFLDARKRWLSACEEAAAQLFIDSMRRQDSPQLCPEPTEEYPGSLAFHDPYSLLYADDGPYAVQLSEVLSEAVGDPVVQGNAVRLLRSILWRVPTWTDAQALVVMPIVYSTVWEAATATELNRRVVGSLEQELAQVEAQVTLPEGAFARPDWWPDFSD
jgi:hypothetical protein